MLSASGTLSPGPHVAVRRRRFLRNSAGGDFFKDWASCFSNDRRSQADFRLKLLFDYG
jgi:hypothetical protein